MLKQWAALDGDTVVHGGFDAPQSYIDNYATLVVDNPDVVTPPWYHPGIEFVDVGGLDPRPVAGYTRVGSSWVAPPDDED